MSLKKFNEIISTEIERARKYEDNEFWHEAKKIWLDLIEYCMLFAKKTPDLKTSIADMIISKAQNLIKRVDRIDEKIRFEKIELKQSVDSPAQADEDLFVIEDEEPEQSDQLKVSPSVSEKHETMEDESNKIINVGEEEINIPDDFPLIEITPSDSFQPPKIVPEKQEIDRTVEIIDEESQKDPNDHIPESQNNSNQPHSDDG